MKTIICLLFASSLANSNVYNYGSLTPGTESVFRFESKSLDNSYDGLGIKADVRVQAFADHTLRVKFENSGIVPKLNDTMALPFGAIVSKEFIGYLEETVPVQLKQGNVKSFFVSRKEPNTVTNIKKYFLSQISLASSNSTQTALKSTPDHWTTELLTKGTITARLPLTGSKTRKETSLLPYRFDTKSTELCCNLLEISSTGSYSVPDPPFGGIKNAFGLYMYHSRYDGTFAYKHVQKKYYLFRLSQEREMTSWNNWVVSNSLGDHFGFIQNSDISHICPEDCNSPWRVGLNYRTKDPKIVVKCAKGCVDDVNGYAGWTCSSYEYYCRDSYVGDWYNKFRAACKRTCSRYASPYCNAVTCKGCVDEYLGYDNVTMKNGYNCNDYKIQCRSDYEGEWPEKIRAACKRTCSLYASEYCYLNTCKEPSPTEKCCKTYNVPNRCLPLCDQIDGVSRLTKDYDDNLLRYCAKFWNEINQCKNGEGEVCSWRQTSGCNANGPRDENNDKPCCYKTEDNWSGYCECANGTKKVEKGCAKWSYSTCKEACQSDVPCDVYDCAPSPCYNGGLCTIKYGVAHCECPEGFYGEHCEGSVYEDACYPDGDAYCHNGGLCRLRKNGEPRCECTMIGEWFAWTGKQCEIPVI